EPAFPAVAEEREQRGEFPARAKHVGRPGVARAVRARVGKPECLAHDDGEGQRADEVRDKGECCGSHVLPLEFATRVYAKVTPWMPSLSASCASRPGSACIATKKSPPRRSRSISRSRFRRIARRSRREGSPTRSTTAWSWSTSGRSSPR